MASLGKAFKKLFSDFAKWSTVVCLNKIVSKIKWIAAVFSIIFAIMLFLFVFITVNLIIKYFKYPSSTDLTLDVESEASDQKHKFPRFSFCNENPLKRSVVDSNLAFAEIAKLMKQYEEVAQQTRTTDDFSIGSTGMSTQRFTRAKTMLRLLMNNLSDADRITGGYSFTELVSECTFAGKTCTSADFSQFLHPDYGVCYSFVVDRNITRAGTEQSLRMLMTVNQDSPTLNVFDFLPTTESASIRAVIHQPDEFPDFANAGFKIGASSQASISLSTIANSRIDLPYGNCTTEGADTDNYYANFTYSHISCQYSCLQQIAWEKCRCVDPGYRKADEHVYCSTPADMLCLVDLVKQSLSNGSAPHCDCFQPCTEKRLQRTITYGQYPSAKYKVAAGTQEQRGVLLEEQGGGRDGVPDEDADDYDHPVTTVAPTEAPVCENLMLSKAEIRATLGDAPANCRVAYKQFYKNPKYTIIQGWPCLSNKTCQTCVMYTDPAIAKWEWPCNYYTYEQCNKYNKNSTTGLTCAEFFLNFDFIPTGVDVPNITDWQSGFGPSSSPCRSISLSMTSTERVDCWNTQTCSRIPSSPDLSKLIDSPLIDPNFLAQANVDSSTTMCSLASAAVWAAREKLMPTPVTYGRKKRSALAPDNTGQSENSTANSTVIDIPGFGSCEYANKNFKGAAECIKWYQRNGLRFELYFGSLTTNKYTQSPTYTLVTMLADVGGHAGLWLGISVVSLVEFFALFVMIFNTAFCRKKTTTGAESIKDEVRNREGMRMTMKGSKLIAPR